MPKPAVIRYPGTPRFKVGDRVTFVRVFDTLPAVVIEDRGKHGVGGRRLCRIRYELPDSGTLEITIPEDDLTPTGNGSPPTRGAAAGNGTADAPPT